MPIYWANIAILSACYGYGFTIGRPDDGGASSEQNQPKWLKFIYKVFIIIMCMNMPPGEDVSNYVVA